ncbi:MAG: OmpH family outer membrane protein [Desulfobacterales bacterium]
MRNLKLLFLVHFFIIIIFIIPSYGADVANIAILDAQKVLDKSLLGKKMTNELNKISSSYSADLEAKGKKIKKLQDELDKLSSLKKTPSAANNEEFDKKSRELEIKIYDFKTLQKKYHDKFKAEETKKFKYTTNIIQEIVNEIGKKEGYLLIKTKIGSPYFQKHIDITDRVIKILDSRYKKDDKKEKP